MKKVIIVIVLIALLAGTSVVVVKKVIPTVTEELRLSGLRPEVRAAFEDFRNDLLTNHKLRLLVGSTKRTKTEQEKNVTSGHSATSHSFHLLGRALDVYPIIEATGKADMIGAHLDLFRTIHTVAPKYGFRGLAFNPDGSKRYITGTKGKIWDGGHLEYAEGMTWAQAAAKDNYVG